MEAGKKLFEDWQTFVSCEERLRLVTRFIESHQNEFTDKGVIIHEDGYYRATVVPEMPQGHENLYYCDGSFYRKTGNFENIPVVERLCSTESERLLCNRLFIENIADCFRTHDM